MKSFDDLEKREQEPHVFIDKYVYQKQRLLFNITRSEKVCSAIEKWLMSFQGGMSKEAFIQQVSKLDYDDDLAISQIDKSMGKRSIQKKRVAMPPLPIAKDAVSLLAEGILFIAVAGAEKALHAYIRQTYQTLKGLGRTYVLDLNDMKLEWVDKFQKGKSPEMIQKAKDAEFLIVVGLETPLDLPFYIGDTVNTIRRYRVEKGLPIISTFARFREKEKFFEYFEKFSVK